MEEQRLQKVLSAHGVASRRQAEQMITEGRVRVNGNTARLGDKVTETDVIEVDGAVLRRAPRPVYIMLHKPRGYVTTCKDEQGRRDVTELVRDCPERVYPVGRLDLNSEGLLLLTNDGALANRLMHPSGQVEKVYLCWVPVTRRGRGKAAGAPGAGRTPAESGPGGAAAGQRGPGHDRGGHHRGPQPAGPPHVRAGGTPCDAAQAHRRGTAAAGPAARGPVAVPDRRGSIVSPQPAVKFFLQIFGKPRIIQ